MLKDLAFTPKEIKDQKAEYASPVPSDPPKYPYGLSLYLETETLAKLGLDITKLDIATEIQFNAVATITSMSASQHADGTMCNSLNLQITHMELGKMVAAAPAPAETAKKLFAK